MLYSFVLLSLLFTLIQAQDWLTQKWDVVVVGAGPAGIIAATRMVEAGLSTLLLEVGGPSYGVTGGDLNARRPSWLNNTSQPLTRVDVPGLYKSIFSDPNGLMCDLNSYGGCTIGGSSAINAGLFFEPPASDYDVHFPPGWKSADMKDATKKLYNRQPSTNLTSQDGKRYLQSGYNVARRWLVEGLGFKEVDINGEADDKTGVFGHPIYDYENGQRGGPVITYLQDALQHPNFRLQTGVRVLRVERNGSVATGLTVLETRNNITTKRLISLQHNSTVILSAGAISSPALLISSGIGPGDQLQSLYDASKLGPNISPQNFIVNPLVGYGLFDNPNTFLELSHPNITSYTYNYDNPPPLDEALYLKNRSGPYTFASQTSVFWDSAINPETNQTVAFQGTIDSSGFREYTSNTTVTMNIYGTSGLGSSGYVTVKDEGKGVAAGDIYYAHNTLDAQLIATFIFKIFQGLNRANITCLNLPSSSSIQEIQTYITTPSPYARGQVNHWSSSCRLGGCVDETTKVKGMENIFVVDGSIVSPLTVNPQFGIMVAAERGSDLILDKLRRVA